LKLLLDSCVWGGAVGELTALGHDVEWSGTWPRDPGDAEILSRAREASRVLITLDKDFGELAIVRGLPHAGIVRLVGFSARQQANACQQILERYGAELEACAIVTAELGRVRIRSGERDEPE
jgi:predicted nuclease of predicted toxin-antitoxin system